MVTSSPLSFVAGDILRITCDASGHSTALLVEPADKGYVMLASLDKPYHRLHAAPQKHAKLYFAQTRGHGAALWLVECSEPSSASVSIRARACGSWLALGADGTWVLRPTPSSWTRQICDPGACVPSPLEMAHRRAASAASRVEGATAPAPSFDSDGYVVLRRLVPEPKLAKALRSLNHHLGSADLAADIEPDGLGAQYLRAAAAHDELSTGAAGTGAAGDDDAAAAAAAAAAPGGLAGGVVKLGGGHRCTCCLAQSAPLLDLMGVEERRAIARALRGTCVGGGLNRGMKQGQCDGDGDGDGDGTLSPHFGCQVALRFPLAPFAAGVADGAAALPALLQHAGGLDWHTDAAKYNEKKSFDVVVGLFLSSVGAAHDGALMVQPGSQRAERRAREAGELGRGALHSGDAVVGGGPEALARAVPILAEPGSVIIFDKDLLHAGAPNLSPDIRYALYYRMRLER